MGMYDFSLQSLAEFCITMQKESLIKKKKKLCPYKHSFMRPSRMLPRSLVYIPLKQEWGKIFPAIIVVLSILYQLKKLAL